MFSINNIFALALVLSTLLAACGTGQNVNPDKGETSAAAAPTGDDSADDDESDEGEKATAPAATPDVPTTEVVQAFCSTLDFEVTDPAVTAYCYQELPKMRRQIGRIMKALIGRGKDADKELRTQWKGLKDEAKGKKLLPPKELDEDEDKRYNDNCPDEPNADQLDNDEDGVGNACDNCRNTKNADQKDGDDDGVGDVCDILPEVKNPGQEDADGDRISDLVDNCRDDSNNDQSDKDKDGVGDVCDKCPTANDKTAKDTDRDGWPDACDNAPRVSNADQSDTDGDKVADVIDNCPGKENPKQFDTDGDKIGDACDSCAVIPNVDQKKDECPAHDLKEEGDRAQMFVRGKEKFIFLMTGGEALMDYNRARIVTDRTWIFPDSSHLGALKSICSGKVAVELQPICGCAWTDEEMEVSGSYDFRRVLLPIQGESTVAKSGVDKGKCGRVLTPKRELPKSKK